jgi:small subunit ribosomal protein S13
MAYLMHKYVSPTDQVSRALQSILGIGSYQAKQLCDEMGFSKGIRIAEITQEDLEQLQYLLTTYYNTGQDITRNKLESIRRLISIGTYKGFRHVAHLPVRGQRTHTNGKSRRRSPRISS